MAVGAVFLCAVCVQLVGAGIASAATCDTSWAAPVSGSWNNAADWTNGVPTTSTNACLTVAGNYTVTVGSFAAFAESVTLGSSTGSTTQELDIAANAPGAELELGADSTVNSTGELVLDSQTGGVGDAWITGPAGATLTNSGKIVVQGEAVGSVGTWLINLDNTSAGTVDVQTGGLNSFDGYTLTNDGTVTIDPGAFFELDGLSGAGLFDNAAGTVTNNGAISLFVGASWSQLGGNETGNPVTMNGGTLTDNGTATSGAVDLLDTVTLSGTVAAGETLDLIGVPSANSVLNFGAAAVTNDGTIVMDSQSGGGSTDLENGTLTNDGTLDTQVEGSQPNLLEAALVNDGTVEVKSGEFRQDANTTTTNDGNVIVDPGAQFNLTTGSDVFDQQSDGTMSFEIASASSFGTLNLSGSATFNLNGGTADPILEGTYAPPVGAEFDVITGPWGSGSYTSVENNFVGDYAHTSFLGLVRARDSTATSVGSSLNPSNYGQSVTFTATVTPGASGVGNPTGTVTFFDNGSSIGTGAVSTTAGVSTATLTTSSLAGGNHPITASYGGDTNYQASSISSPTLAQVVKQDNTSTTLKSSANPASSGQPVTFTATVTPTSSGSANPTGTVTFYDNGTQIGTGPASTTAGTTTATFTTSSLSSGSHPITATYGGDTSYATSTTLTALSQVVNPATPVGCTMTSAASTAFSAGAIQITNSLSSNLAQTQQLSLRSLSGRDQAFRLTRVTKSACHDNLKYLTAAGHSFNTISDTGTGAYGKSATTETPGYSITFEISNGGHTGGTPSKGSVTFTITSGGKVIWSGTGTLTSGSEAESG